MFQILSRKDFHPNSTYIACRRVPPIFLGLCNADEFSLKTSVK